MSNILNRDLKTAHILIIDDNETNLEIVQELLIVAGYTQVEILSDPTIAVATILSEMPALVLLDLHMPKVTGYEILGELSLKLPQSACVPILVFTADSTPAARQKALDLGANDFITKPIDNLELTLRVRNFLRMRNMHQAIHNENLALEERVRQRTADMDLAREEGLQCLARALEYRDDATGGHVRRVGIMSANLADGLGLSNSLVQLIGLAAPLHDLGKIGISDSLLLKPGRYTPEEFDVMKRHTVLGATIVNDCRSPVLRMVREISLCHHEKWDGSGYPHGLRGSEIPISCRIVAVADMFDALTTERPYKAAWSHSEAVAEIVRQSGKHFDPAIVEIFVELYGSVREPILAN